MNKEEIVRHLIIKYLRDKKDDNSNIPNVVDALLKSWGLTIDNIQEVPYSIIELIPDPISEEEKFELLVQKGNIYLGSGNFDQSIECFSEAISMNSSISDLYSRRAAAHMKKLNYAEAVNDLKIAIHLDPQNSVAYNRLIFCYWSLSDNENAINTCAECQTKGLKNEALQNLEHLVKKYSFNENDSSSAIFQSATDVDETTA